MRTQGVMRHELFCDLFGKRVIKAATDIDRCQFPTLACVVHFEFCALALEVGLFGIGLRMHGHILARRHRHGARDQSGDSGDQYAAVRSVCGRNAQHQARGRNDTVIRAQDRSA